MERFLAIAEKIARLRKEAAMRNPEQDYKAGYDEPFLDRIAKESSLEELPEMMNIVRTDMKNLLGLDNGEEQLIRYMAMQVLWEPDRISFLKNFESEKWTQAICPFCGSRPGLSKIKEDGRRTLICHFCWTEWNFVRISCPFCGNNGGEYALFEMDNVEVRLDFCDNCKGYVKTFLYDRELESPAVWDLKSMFMDKWAERQGYVRPEPSLIGIDFSK